LDNENIDYSNHINNPSMRSGKSEGTISEKDVKEIIKKFNESLNNYSFEKTDLQRKLN
jgi:hypothetical protein